MRCCRGAGPVTLLGSRSFEPGSVTAAPAEKGVYLYCKCCSVCMDIVEAARRRRVCVCVLPALQHGGGGCCHRPLLCGGGWLTGRATWRPGRPARPRGAWGEVWPGSGRRSPPCDWPLESRAAGSGEVTWGRRTVRLGPVWLRIWQRGEGHNGSVSLVAPSASKIARAKRNYNLFPAMT